MPKLTFYHQVRADGGQRTGVDCEDTEVLHFFNPGTEQHDPRLLWYLDVRCEGDALPEGPEHARSWLLKNHDFFVSQLNAIADEGLDAGFDAEVKPLQRELSGAPDGAQITVVVFAVRRLLGREMADKVRAVARNWTSLIESLAPLSVV